MKKRIWKIVRTLGILWGILFAVFYFDLDGKLLYYVWEPLMDKKYGKMPRPDMTKMPYGKKKDVMADDE